MEKHPVADNAKMDSRLNSDKDVCGVLEDDCRLPEEESDKESDSILVFTAKKYLRKKITLS